MKYEKKNEKEAEDKENATIELSAGVGGAESGLFCSELYATYEAYANYMGWSFVPVRVDTEKMALTEMMRKAVFEVYGQNVFKYLKFESGINCFLLLFSKWNFIHFYYVHLLVRCTSSSTSTQDRIQGSYSYEYSWSGCQPQARANQHRTKSQGSEDRNKDFRRTWRSTCQQDRVSR